MTMEDMEKLLGSWAANWIVGAVDGNETGCVWKWGHTMEKILPNINSIKSEYDLVPVDSGYTPCFWTNQQSLFFPVSSSWKEHQVAKERSWRRRLWMLPWSCSREATVWLMLGCWAISRQVQPMCDASFFLTVLILCCHRALTFTWMMRMICIYSCNFAVKGFSMFLRCLQHWCAPAAAWWQVPSSWRSEGLFCWTCWHVSIQLSPL